MNRCRRGHCTTNNPRLSPMHTPTSSGDVVRRFLLRRNENLSSRLQDDVLMCFVRKKQYVASGGVLGPFREGVDTNQPIYGAKSN